MSLPLDKAIARYASMSDPEKAQVRGMVFSEISAVDEAVERTLQMPTNLYNDRFVALIEAFVTANAADFSQAELTSAVSARQRIRGRFALAANAIPGVTATLD